MSRIYKRREIFLSPNIRLRRDKHNDTKAISTYIAIDLSMLELFCFELFSVNLKLLVELLITSNKQQAA